MLSFNGVKSSCQITLPKINGQQDDSQAEVTSNKWQKSKSESKVDEHKVYLSKNFVFATCQSSVVIHHCNYHMKLPGDSPVNQVDIDCLTLLKKQREVILHCSTSSVTCLGFDENTSTLCICCDEIIHLVRWDSLLSIWEQFPISEGEGRILSCCISVKDTTAFITLFKRDNVVIYSIKALHELIQPGPLLLEKIECIAVLEKTKDPTSFSKSFIEQNLLRIISVSSGNATSVMLWELVLDSPEPQLKLVHHQTVGQTKVSASCDAHCKDGKWFVVVMNPEGYGEIFLIQPLGFVLINRIKLEGNSEPSLCTDGSPGQAEFRVLGSKFFFPNVQQEVQLDSSNSEDIEAKDLSAGDASFTSDLDNSFGEPSILRRNKLLMCPKLIVAIATSRNISFIDVKNGELELQVKYEDLLQEPGIFVQNIKMFSTDEGMIAALQPCLTRIVFHRSFQIAANDMPTEQPTIVSLVPQEILNPKSVLRKKIKSPPKERTEKGVRGCRRLSGPRSKYLPVKPPWARSRSKPLSEKKPITGPLMSARTPSSSQTNISLPDEPLPSSRPVRIPGGGSYKNLTLDFCEDKKINLNTALSEGLSYMRLSFHHAGKMLAVGGSVSPLLIMKTQPFDTIRRLKDVSKTTSLGFSFNSDYLVMAANDRKTAVINWKTGKELLTFDFNSKFNEHLHAQFYFMDKFILQLEENKIVLYSYARRDAGLMKLQAGSFSLPCQSITAAAAANQFYSNIVVCGLSNKNLAVFDTNAEKVALTISQTHGKTISCVRLNEAPKGNAATELCDVFLTSSTSSFDPIKLWDLRSARCIVRISDTNPTYLVPSSRPALSPCGRYIASGFEENTLILYDIRNVGSRLMSFKGLRSSVMDCAFDTNMPMIWSACRNGTFWNFYT